MRSVIMIIGVLQVLGGILFFLGSKSAIHEILGSLTFGLGILSIALGTVIGELQAMRRAGARDPIDTDRDRAPTSGGLAIAPGKPMRWPAP